MTDDPFVELVTSSHEYLTAAQDRLRERFLLSQHERWYLAERHWRDLLEVRTYGEHHGLWRLTTPKCEAEETDGWEMTAVAARILHAQGAYRVLYPHTFYFLPLDNVTWLEPR